MKNYFLVLAHLFFGFLGFSQLDTGIYEDNKGDYLKIQSNQYLEFRFVESSGLGNIVWEGEGQYNLFRNKIKVDLKNNNAAIPISSFSEYRVKDSNLFTIRVIDTGGKPIPYVAASYRMSTRKHKGTYANSSGLINLKLDTMPIDSIVKLALIGYKSVYMYLDSTRGAECLVILKEGDSYKHSKKRMKIKFEKEGDLLKINLCAWKRKFVLIQKESE